MPQLTTLQMGGSKGLLGPLANSDQSTTMCEMANVSPCQLLSAIPECSHAHAWAPFHEILLSCKVHLYILFLGISAVPSLTSCPNLHPDAYVYASQSFQNVHPPSWVHFVCLAARRHPSVTRAFVLGLLYWILGLKMSLPDACSTTANLRQLHFAGDGSECDPGRSEPGWHTAILPREWTYYSSGYK